MTAFALVLDVVCCALCLHAVVNAILLRRPPRLASVDERVSVLLPLRNEAQRLAPMLRSVLAQQGVGAIEVLGYDDESSDATAAILADIGADRVTIVPTRPLPAGWLGKPHACAVLAAAATGDVLVFVDADVRLAPDAVAGAVQLMRTHGLGFVSPYPRQLAHSWLERLVQPLLTWSWLTLLPLRPAERSRRPSLAAANGQFLVVDAPGYRAAGGHAAVRADVVDDVALARALRATGARGGFVDGHAIATCRMYDDARGLLDGYAKSLWTAFGSTSGAVVVAVSMLVVWCAPWVLLGWTLASLPAAAAGIVSRLVAALRTGSRPAIDAVAHPLSVIAFVALVGLSLVRHRRGRLVWKERSVA